MMKTIFLCVCFLGACIYNPNGLSGQESLLVKTIRGHAGTVNSVAFSPDGKYLASGGMDSALKIWRVEDGSCVQTLKGHKSYVNSVAFSPDGKKLASASADKTIKLWNVEDGSCINTLKGHRDYIRSAAFFPDGERIASGSDDRTIKIWRINSKKAYKTLKGHSGYVYSVSISSDGSRIASGSTDNTIKLWDVASGLCTATLEGHTNPVNSVSFSPTGNYLASGSDDGAVKIWQMPDNLCVKTFTGRRQPVLAVAYSPDGNYIFSGNGDNTIKAWHLFDVVRMKTLTGHRSPVKSAALSPDGDYLASGSFDKTIRIWLTPWEAKRRSDETQKIDAIELKKDKNYDLHYNAGLQLLSSPTIMNRIRAIEEFKKALSHKQGKTCEDKLAETVDALKSTAITALKYLLAVIVALAFLKRVARIIRKIESRKTLPGAIKRETFSGNYESALKLYAEYKAIGGNPQNLPQQELLELYRGLRALDELPKENIPYNFLLSYAVTLAKEANYKQALAMLREGLLVNAFKASGEYDAFVEIYEKAGRPQDPLTLKLNPSACSGLAEAFFKVKDYDSAAKICALKNQFHAAKVSPRDSELLAACRKNIEEIGKLRKKPEIKWRCINCGYVHQEQKAPQICPTCAHSRDYFQALTE